MKIEEVGAVPPVVANRSLLKDSLLVLQPFLGFMIFIGFLVQS